MSQSTHKLVCLGDTAVGKTSIINQSVYGNHMSDHQPTLGVDFFVKVLRDPPVRFQIWDTAGQERFHALVTSYVRQSTVAFLVFDITSKESFEALKRWHTAVLDLAQPALFVIGNKIDLQDQRAVTTEDGQRFADSISAKYYETSVVTNANIEEVFAAAGAVPLPEAVSTVSATQTPVQTVDLSTVMPKQQSGSCFC
jgi:Ras-related protein Rab-6A